jgi:hypothetical protein
VPFGYIEDPNATFASYGSATTKIGGRPGNEPDAAVAATV